MRLFVCICVCVCIWFYAIFRHYLFTWPNSEACRILVPWTEIKPGLLVVEDQSCNHWTTREFLHSMLFHHVDSYDCHSPDTEHSSRECFHLTFYSHTHPLPPASLTTASTHLFSSCIILSCQGCHTGTGIICCVTAWDGLFSLNIILLRSMLLATDVYSLWLLSRIPWDGCTSCYGT